MLERYFNDIHKRKLDFSCNEQEVELIRTGIETLVTKFVSRLRDQTYEDIKNGVLRKYLIDIYEREPTYDILKVGSFYEGTKNGYPDEFDFICVLGYLNSSPITVKNSPFLSVKENVFEAAAEVMSALYSERNNIVYRTAYRNGSIKLDSIVWKFDESRPGPSIKFRFVYKKRFTTDIVIHVDLVPAFKVRLEDMNHTVDLNKFCSLPEFCSEIAGTGSYLVVGGDISFTETEVHFMTTVLSRKHVKAYRILKYLITGLHDDDTLATMFQVFNHPVHISSYKIKTVLIFHHYECKNTDTEDITQCVIDMCSTLHKCYEKRQWRHLNKDLDPVEYHFQIIPMKIIACDILNELHQSLVKFKNLQEPYCFKKCDKCIVPFAKSMLQTINNTYSNRSALHTCVLS